MAFDDEIAYDEIDALLVERNAARAEASLWRQRFFEQQQELRQAKANFVACDKSHVEWEAAHAEVLQMLRRTEVKLADALWERDSAQGMLSHYRAIVGMFARGEWLIDIHPELYREEPLATKMAATGDAAGNENKAQG